MVETVNKSNGIKFALRNVRYNTNVTLDIPYHSTLAAYPSVKKMEYPETNDLAFYATMLGQQISLDANQNTSEVIYF